MATLKRIGPGSMFKLMGFLYVFIGLIIGAVVTLIALAGAKPAGGGGALSALFGAAAIVVFPILYGVLGAIAGAIGAWLYNFCARVVGGLELDLE